MMILTIMAIFEAEVVVEEEWIEVDSGEVEEEQEEVDSEEEVATTSMMEGVDCTTQETKSTLAGIEVTR
jgi:hypothetical protein